MKKIINALIIFLALIAPAYGVSCRNYAGSGCDIAVCPAPDDCVIQGRCFPPNSPAYHDTDNYALIVNGVTGDIDADGDMDYCRGNQEGGIWTDCGPGCQNNECCNAGEICDVAIFDCVPDQCDSDASQCINICKGAYYYSAPETYTFESGTPNCCGDDANEVYTTCLNQVAPG